MLPQEVINRRRERARRKYYRIKNTIAYKERHRKNKRRRKQRRYFKYLSETLRQKFDIQIPPWYLWKLAKSQRLRCPLTGRRLTRENISLDHKVPVSKGGTHDLMNLRFVDYHANLAKSHFSEMELVLLARDICKNFSQYEERPQQLTDRN